MAMERLVNAFELGATTMRQRPTGRFLGLILLFILSLTLAVPQSASQLGTPPQSYIVQADNVAAARAAVQAVGGHITHELGIIDAVGAELTLQQHQWLTANDAITHIHDNTPLTTTTVTATYADNFNTRSYANNDGSHNWSTNWQEIGENSDPYYGDVKIENNQLSLKDDDRGIFRHVDLDAATTATLSFEYRRHRFDSSDDYIALEISTDNGDNWTELDRFAGPHNDYHPQSTSYDISNYLSATTVIRFITSPHHGNYDTLYLDNLEIVTNEDPSPPPSPAPQLTVTGPPSATYGQPYTVNLNATTAVNSWTIDWGDGTIETLPGHRHHRQPHL